MLLCGIRTLQVLSDIPLGKWFSRTIRFHNSKLNLGTSRMIALQHKKFRTQHYLMALHDLYGMILALQPNVNTVDTIYNSHILPSWQQLFGIVNRQVNTLTWSIQILQTQEHTTEEAVSLMGNLKSNMTG